MNDRENDLVKARPQISPKSISENMSKDERFQNSTLRPVIKLQSPLLIAAFRNYIAKRKNVFYDLSMEKRLLYIENAIQKDMKFRNSLKGMIIGQFTLQEYQTYIQNSSPLNKRMMNIVVERLKDNILLFEKDIAFSAVI
ncbi:glyoxalase [uncultured Kordia sp.]|uniref:glyoxalase n=1 Tax=uncultured Kordia sp. TaxID=507699 RepID=UPI00262033C3|nr:glyoxalase [uncultured Kordia sp.]